MTYFYVMGMYGRLRCKIRKVETVRIAKIIEQKTGASWFDCVQAANEVSICLEVEKKKEKKKKK